MENASIERGSNRNPSWWNKDHDSAWERIKAALKADWEQTKADFSSEHGADLDQDAVDTLKQMAGKQPVPNALDRDEWERAEPGLRFGHGAARQFDAEADDFDENVEARLRKEWEQLKTGRTWEEIKDHARRGWEWGRRKVH